MTSPESGDHFSGKRSYRLTSNLADELSLSENQLIRATVVSSLPDDSEKLIVNIRGKKVVAQSQLDVEESQPLLVRVESLEHPIELRLLDPDNASDELRDNHIKTFLDQNNLEHSDSNVELFREWLNQSLPLQEDLLRRTFNAKNLITDRKGRVDGNRLWAMVFLMNDQFPVTADLVDLLGEARSSDVGGSLTRLQRTSVGSFCFGDPNTSIRNSVRSMGIDAVNLFGKKPHTASKTLHSRLLKAIKNQNTFDGTSDGYRGILGLILGSALMSLKQRTAFNVFFPFVDAGEVRLFWMRGFRSDDFRRWCVNCRMNLSNVGPMGVGIDCEQPNITVEFRTEDESILDKLRNHQDRLTVSLQSSYDDVTVKFENVAPGTGTDLFAENPFGFDRSTFSFIPGMDVTV